jgi:N-acetylneuraminic acid mutarotase
MPTARSEIAGAVLNDKIYIIGGRTTGMASNVNANEAYDPLTDKWIILEPMPSKRGGLSSAAIAVNGSIYVFGGGQPTSTFSNNEKFDVVSDAWISEMGMPTARHGLVAVAIADLIYVIGGGPQPGGSSSSLTEIFNTSKG